MAKIRICRDCTNVKILDRTVGRCLAEKNGMLFCRLDDPKHVCKKFKRETE